MLASSLLPQAIAEYYTRHPDVRIELRDVDLSTVVEEVKAGHIDMGFGSFEKSPGIRRTPFFRFSLMVIRPEFGSGVHRTSCSWAGLRHEKLILQAPAAPSRRIIDEQLSSVGLSSTPAMSLNRLDTV